MKRITQLVILFILMSSRKLPNYLRTQRKRVGFTQDELAFLLGCEHFEMVCRYERSIDLPVLKIALAYHAIFGTSLQELFAGVYEEIEQQVITRAEELAQRIYTDNPDPQTARKLDQLRAIIFAPEIIAENE